MCVSRGSARCVASRSASMLSTGRRAVQPSSRQMQRCGAAVGRLARAPRAGGGGVGRGKAQVLARARRVRGALNTLRRASGLLTKHIGRRPAKMLPALRGAAPVLRLLSFHSHTLTHPAANPASCPPWHCATSSIAASTRSARSWRTARSSACSRSTRTTCCVRATTRARSCVCSACGRRPPRATRMSSTLPWSRASST